MKLGDLWIMLGIKDDGKVIQSLNNVKGSLADVNAGALALKAGILAAFYGLEQLTAASNATGNALTQFQNLTGMSAEMLQRYQYAARQVGVSNDEVTGSFKSLQTAMTNMALGKGAPEGIGWVARITGGLDNKKLTDTVYMFGKLQEFARKAPPALARQVLGSFGLSEGIIQAMNRGAFNEGSFKRAPIYSSGEVAQLQKADVAWSNLGTKIKMAIGHLNAEHGVSLTNNISKIVTQMVRLAEALDKLATKTHAFELLNRLLTQLADFLEIFTAKPEDLKKLDEKHLNENGVFGGHSQKEVIDYLTDKNNNATLMDTMKAMLFDIIPQNYNQSNVNQTQHVNTHIHTDNKNPKDHADHVNKNIHAFYQSPALLAVL